MQYILVLAGPLLYFAEQNFVPSSFMKLPGTLKPSATFTCWIMTVMRCLSSFFILLNMEETVLKYFCICQINCLSCVVSDPSKMFKNWKTQQLSLDVRMTVSLCLANFGAINLWWRTDIRSTLMLHVSIYRVFKTHRHVHWVKYAESVLTAGYFWKGDRIGDFEWAV